MLSLRIVARQAEAAIRLEPRDRGFPMTRVAAHMRIHGVRVRGANLAAGMTAGAVAARRMVVFVACGAGFDRRRGRERHGSLMARRARKSCVRGMRERDDA